MDIKLIASGTITIGEIRRNNAFKSLSGSSYCEIRSSGGFNGYVHNDIWYPNDGSKPFKYVYLLVKGKDDNKPIELSIEIL